jgi:AraC-like DNA-binding protein/mannose-6-phosphate isomerase-like protein (cupin superfamily)
MGKIDIATHDVPFVSVRTLGLSLAHLSENVPVWLRLERHSADGSFCDVPEQLAHLPHDEGAGHIPVHGHDFCEIALVLAGEFTHITESGSQPLHRGSVVIVPRGAVHGYETARDMMLVNLFCINEWLVTDLPELWLSPTMIHLFLADVLFHRLRRPQPSQITLDEASLRRIIWELADLGGQLHPTPRNTLYIRACLEKLFSLLCQAYVKQWPDAEIRSFRPEVLFVLEEVEQCLSRGEGVDVRRLAATCGLSGEHLSRVFQEAVGLTVMQYFQKRRAQHACRLLAGGKAAPTQIAHDLGFADYAHFRRQFSRYIGVTPSAFLKQSSRDGA